MDPDLTHLSDEDLLALLRAACAEAVTRGAEVAAAARAAYQRELEAAAQLRAAAARAREDVAATLRAAEIRAREDAERDRWAMKKGAATAVAALLARAGYGPGGGLEVQVWASGTARPERRVYLGYGFSAGGSRPDNRVAYYATGNRKHPPGSVELFDRDLLPLRAEVVALCAALAASWEVVRFDVAAALAWEGAAATWPPPATLEPAP